MIWRLVFGAKAQVIVGSVCLVVGAGSWLYGSTLSGAKLLSFIFHVSMFFGCVACYAIVATGLGYRATERVESVVADTDEHAESGIG